MTYTPSSHTLIDIMHALKDHTYQAPQKVVVGLWDTPESADSTVLPKDTQGALAKTLLNLFLEYRNRTLQRQIRSYFFSVTFNMDKDCYCLQAKTVWDDISDPNVTVFLFPKELTDFESCNAFLDAALAGLSLAYGGPSTPEDKKTVLFLSKHFNAPFEILIVKDPEACSFIVRFLR